MRHAIGRLVRFQSCATLLAILGLAGFIQAGLIAYDDLEDAALGSLGGQTSGTGFTAGYVIGSGAVGVVTNESLTYSNGPLSMDGGTNAIYVAYPDRTVFTRAIGTQNGDALYLSFLFRTPTADGNSNEDFLSFGFNNSVGEPSAGIVHRYNAGSTDHGFGIRYGTSQLMLSEGTEANRTYFLVLRLRKLTPGAANVFNELALFVDPDSVYEPEPSLVVTNTRWAAATHIAARIALSESGDSYLLDNVCVGESYDDVVFPSGSPVVSAPVILPPGGDIGGAATVSITSATESATIRYTTDGTTPSSTVGTLYTAPFALTELTQVQAIAYKAGLFDSPVSSVEYRIYKHWTGLGSDDLWSTADNWYTSGSPAWAELMFDDADTNSVESVNNILASSLTVSSLSYTNSGSSSYHVTQINPGVTLTVDGSTSPVNALFVGRTEAEVKTTRTRVSMTGGGSLVVNAPASDVLITKSSTNERGISLLNLAELSRFDAIVKDFAIGRRNRSTAFVTLAVTNSIVAEKIGVGDSGGNSNGDHSELILGTGNTFHADEIGIGGPVLNTFNENGGKVYFAENLDNPTLTIRGSSGGTSRANLKMASHGSQSGTWKSTRSISGELNVLGGTIDARLRTLILSQGRSMQTRGSTTATLSMDGGLVDAETVIIGSSDAGSSDGNPAKGILNVGGGAFAAGPVTMGSNISGGVAVFGELNVSGSGSVEVDGPLVLGSRDGTASVEAAVNLTGGKLVVLGDMAPGTDPANLVSLVSMSGGQLVVTNAAADATLQIENGVLAISGGTALLDTLVTTNALCTTQVVLAGTDAGDYGQITVNEEVRLGGTLDVTFAEGFEPLPGDIWTLVEGTGVRQGQFETTVLPEGVKVVYTAGGYQLAYPGAATILLVR